MQPSTSPNLTDPVRDDQTDGLVGELYRRYSAWLEAMVRRSGGGDGSEDIVQETYLRIARYPSDTVFQHPQALLMQVAKNLLINTARRERAAKRTAPSDGDLNSPLRVEADQFEHVALRETILALPEIYRDVFMLSRFDGMSYDQIAEARGISVKTVEWRMSRALAMCAARMRE